MRSKRFWAGALAASLLASTAVACGDDDDGGEKSGATGGQDLKGVSVSVAAKWTGKEQQNFQQVLDAFAKKTGATVEYKSTGEDTAAYLNPKIKGGQPPDVAILPQPGLMRQYAAKNNLKPLTDDVNQAISQNYTPYWKDLGSVDDKTYGVMVKAAYKSIMWYETGAYDEAGVQPPAAWADLVKAAGTLSDSGQTPFAIAGAPDNAWTLTDWFENVYISLAGPEMYDKLAKHEIKWTDPSVTKSLEALAQIWGKEDWIAGGRASALKAKFDDSLNTVFAQKKAATVWGGDFAAAVIGETKSKVGEDAKTYAFPKAGDTAPAILGGDLAVALKDGKGAMGLMKYLASPEAGETWGKLGGYLSPSKNVKADVYPDPLTKQLAQQMQAAGDAARYDLSDLTPSSFGATPDKGMWGALRDFLAKPSDVKGTQAKLEAAAKKAYK